MRTALLGLTIPLLLLTAAFATVVPQASAETAVHEVSGYVVSDSGTGLAGVRVTGYTYGEDPAASTLGEQMALTDADGRFTLGLAPGKGYVSVWYEEWRAGDEREILVEGPVNDLNFTLKTPPPRTAIVSGTIVDRAGNPIEGAEVRLEYGCCYAMPMETDAATPPSEPAPEPGTAGGSTDGSDAKMASGSSVRPAILPPYDDGATTTTGADGRFSFKSYAGPRQITAWAKGFAQTSVPIEARENEETQTRVELAKVPARDAILTGRVVDSAGAPVGGAQVSVRSLEWGRYAEATTGADGSYRLETVPGWTEVSVNVWPNYGEPMPLMAESDVAIARPLPLEPKYHPSSALIGLESGANTFDATLVMKPAPTIALTGYVVDPVSKGAVESARVSVWNHETGDWGEAITDATGSFRIMVRAGHYSGNAWKEGYLSATQSFLVNDGAAQRVDVLMPKGETRWAPCYDESDCGPVMMYARGEAKSAAVYDGPASQDAAATGAPAVPPAAGMEPTPEDTMALEEESGTANPTEGPDRSRSATFSGTGGGLPPYDPVATSSGSETPTPPAGSEVPGLALVGLLAVLGLAALALRRR